MDWVIQYDMFIYEEKIPFAISHKGDFYFT